MTNRHYDIPPLDFLQGFEAAARTLSFTKAAEELFITQSAVSRQIKSLEENLGVRLFHRRPRTLELTEEGHVLLRAVTGALDLLHGATQELRADRDLLTVTTTNGFASLWLIPRLVRFTSRYPDVDVRISATTGMLNLERNRIDLAIRYCRPDLAPPDAVKLFSETTVPVCSPDLTQRADRPLVRPKDLRWHTLLHYDHPGAAGTFMEWGTWLTALGLGDLKPAGALRFNMYDQLVQAAIAGQGVGLGQRRLMSELLQSGKLVVPFDTKDLGNRAYYMLTSPAGERKTQVRAFSDWLLEESQQSDLADPDAG